MMPRRMLWEEQRQHPHRLSSSPIGVETPASSAVTSDHHHGDNRPSPSLSKSTFPWASYYSPSVECHDGRVTYRSSHQHRDSIDRSSFITEALTNYHVEDDEEDYYFYHDDDDIDIDVGDDEYEYDARMTREDYYSPSEGEEYCHPSYPLLMYGCAEDEALVSYQRMDPPQQEHPIKQEEEKEGRLVVVPQRQRNTLEPEEYLNPRDFTSLAKPLPDPLSNSSTRRSSGSNGRRSSDILPRQRTVPSFSNNNDRVVKSSHEQYNGYQHCFVTVLTEHRFLMLYTFLTRHSHSKVVVLFSTTKSLSFYTTLLRRLKFNVRAVHDGMERNKVSDTLREFSRAESNEEIDAAHDDDGGSTSTPLVLCMLDFQGHDIRIPPATNWIVQFEPCANPSEYIYQVGRISHDNVAARRQQRRESYSSRCSSKSNNGRRGSSTTRKETPPRALLFLAPNEYGFHKYYKVAQVKIYEYEIPQICNVQNRLIKFLRCDENAELRTLGLRACRAYLFAYAKHDFGDIYNVDDLDVEKVALCFGFEKLPSSELLGGIRCGDVDDDYDGENVDLLEKGRSSTCTSSWRRKPAKACTSWMAGEKTWNHADIAQSGRRRVNSPRILSNKPRMVVTR